MAAAFALLAAGCGGPADPDLAIDLLRVSCRIYPTEVVENTSQSTFTFPCVLDRGGTVVLRCGDANLTRDWEYASLEDFVGEVGIPNKFRRIGAETAFRGTLRGSSSTTVEYEYDGQRRLAVRRRFGHTFLGTVLVDTTTFDSYDAAGRPTAARVQSPSGEERVSISYDDAARQMSWSNGERHRMDRHGNTLVENGREYRIVDTAEVCL